MSAGAGGQRLLGKFPGRREQPSCWEGRITACVSQCEE